MIKSINITDSFDEFLKSLDLNEQEKKIIKSFFDLHTSKYPCHISDFLLINIKSHAEFHLEIFIDSIEEDEEFKTDPDFEEDRFILKTLRKFIAFCPENLYLTSDDQELWKEV